MDDNAFVPNVPASTNDDVLASEAATYAFCAKAWHLEHVLQRPVAKQVAERRATGTALHEEDGVRLVSARRVRTRLVFCSILLLGLAAALLVVGLFANL
jgi:hypothetical protein